MLKSRLLIGSVLLAIVLTLSLKAETPSTAPAGDFAGNWKWDFDVQGSTITWTSVFKKDGDTTLKAIGLYRVGASGNPTFWRTITPARVL